MDEEEECVRDHMVSRRTSSLNFKFLRTLSAKCQQVSVKASAVSDDCIYLCLHRFVFMERETFFSFKTKKSCRENWSRENEGERLTSDGVANKFEFIFVGYFILNF